MPGGTKTLMYNHVRKRGNVVPRCGFHLAYLALDTDVNRAYRIDLHLCSHRRMLAFIVSSRPIGGQVHYVPNLTTNHHDAACLLFDNMCNHARRLSAPAGPLHKDIRSY
ncbi:unnamed protein product [Ectocarpus sp. 13 AM-2016]